MLKIAAFKLLAVILPMSLHWNNMPLIGVFPATRYLEEKCLIFVLCMQYFECNATVQLGLLKAGLRIKRFFKIRLQHTQKRSRTKNNCRNQGKEKWGVRKQEERRASETKEGKNYMKANKERRGNKNRKQIHEKEKTSRRGEEGQKQRNTRRRGK